MSLSLSTHQSASSHSAPSRRGKFGISVIVLVLLLLGGGGWYYFFGQKPKVAFSVPVAKTDGFSEGYSWPVGDGSRVAILAAGELKLCSIDGEKVLWSAKIPELKEVDPKWQEGINSRFVKLHEWSASLTAKRANLATQQAIKAFNDEAAKYQAELLATRTAAAKPPLQARPAIQDDGDSWPEETKLPAPVGTGNIKDRIANARAIASTAAAQTEAAQKVGESFQAKPPAVAPTAPPPVAPDFSGRAASAPKLNAVISPEVRILQGRMDKRKAALAEMDGRILKKTKAAKTPLAQEEVQELQSKRAALAAEQQADEAEVAKALGTEVRPPVEKPIPAVPALVSPLKSGEPVKVAAAPVPAADSSESGDDESGEDFSFLQQGPPQLAVLGERIWIIEGPRALAFGLEDGALKAEARLAGNASRVFSHESAVFVVADAGKRARQITKFDTAGATQSLYLPAPPREQAYNFSLETGYRINIQPHRVEFTAAGGSIARADVRLVARKTKMRDLIKPGTEKKLAEKIGNSAGNSLDEVTAISKMMEVDNMKANGNAKEEIDESTYEVTLSRPFEPAIPAWKGTLTGRVQVLSTPSLDLVTAGTKVVAIDRANKQVWEATLGAPIPMRGDDAAWEEKPLPLLEQAGRLFLADGAFLTAIQINSGQVLWRLPSVGIRKVLSDADSNVYVQTDNLAVDTLSYMSTEDIAPPTSSTIKVDAETGKILWNAEKFEDVWISGNDVYALRHMLHGGDLENQVFDPSKVPEARIKIYKLSRRSGKPTWDWYQSRRPHSVIPYGKYVSILFGDELQVIHSIAL